MRGFMMTAVLLASTAGPAFALQAGDTMSAWKQASEEERSELFKRLFGDTGKAGLRRCLDETSRAPGHADLTIREIAKACASAGTDGQPV